jgi:phosphoribosylanthranilate isomerase
VFVKICGIRDTAALDAAVGAGANAVGFIFAASPRRVTPAQAAQLCRNLPRHVLRVGVMLHPSDAEWTEVMEVFAPDWLQCDAEDLQGRALPAHCVPLPVLRTGRAIAPPSVLPARVLVEAAVSGMGLEADWPEAAALACRTQVILAGGLRPDNLAAAIAQVRPWGVDVSSGVEHAPGHKDPRLIETFVARVRELEATL